MKLKSTDKKLGIEQKNKRNNQHVIMHLPILFFIFIFFSLTLTSVEEQVVASNLVHETNCIISMPEFALRLQINVDDPLTAELFRIFDTVRN